MPKAVICYHHSQIIAKVTEILSIERRDYTSIESLLEDVKSLATDIYRSSNLALADGRSMENRLKAYKKAIEGLGFERKKVNNNLGNAK